MADLEIDARGGTHTVRLNRPHALNAITTRMKDDLLAALDRAEADPDAVCLVLTGTGRAFCSGADVRELAAAAGGGEALQASLTRVERTQTIVERLRRSRLATVAAVNGLAAGGGVSLALGCDVVLAAATVRFSLLFGRRGLVPDGALSRNLVEAVGRRRALALALTCADVSAEDAQRRGLIDEVVPGGELDARVGEVTAEITARGPATVSLTKRVFAAPAHADLALEALAQAVALAAVPDPQDL